jgi:hypothetical protein
LKEALVATFPCAKHSGYGCGLRCIVGAAAFSAIFFLDVPFPLIVLVAGLIGFFGGRAAFANLGLAVRA